MRRHFLVSHGHELEAGLGSIRLRFAVSTQARSRIPSGLGQSAHGPGTSWPGPAPGNRKPTEWMQQWRGRGPLAHVVPVTRVASRQSPHEFVLSHLEQVIYPRTEAKRGEAVTSGRGAWCQPGPRDGDAIHSSTTPCRIMIASLFLEPRALQGLHRQHGLVSLTKESR